MPLVLHADANVQSCTIRYLGNLPSENAGYGPACVYPATHLEIYLYVSGGFQSWDKQEKCKCKRYGKVKVDGKQHTFIEVFAV